MFSRLRADSVSDCCLLCEGSPVCNAWTWCPAEAGCNLTAAEPMPFQACDMKYQNEVCACLNTSQREGLRNA